MKNKILLFTILTFLVSACENWIIFDEKPKNAKNVVTEKEAQDFIKTHQTDFFKTVGKAIRYAKVLTKAKDTVILTLAKVQIKYEGHKAVMVLFKNKKGETDAIIGSGYTAVNPYFKNSKKFTGTKMLWSMDGKLKKRESFISGKPFKTFKTLKEVKDFVKKEKQNFDPNFLPRVWGGGGWCSFCEDVAGECGCFTVQFIFIYPDPWGWDDPWNDWSWYETEEQRKEREEQERREEKARKERERREREERERRERQIERERVESIKNYLTGKARDVYNKLNVTSKDFNNIIKKFDGSFTVKDLIFKYGKIKDPNTYANTRLLKSYSEVLIKIDKSKLRRLTDLGVALVITHEVIHAKMKLIVHSRESRNIYDFDFSEVFRAYGDWNDKGENYEWQHQLMADRYISVMADILQKYDNYKHYRQIYEDIAWFGLQRTVHWRIIKRDYRYRYNRIKRNWRKYFYKR